MRFLIAFGLLCIGAAFAAVVAVVMTVEAHAQGQRCLPLESLIEQAKTNFQEEIAWQGVMDGPSEIILLQSQSGSFTIAVIQGVTACVVAHGEDGTGTVVTGRGA